jgi:hypothetical protein
MWGLKRNYGLVGELDAGIAVATAMLGTVAAARSTIFIALLLLHTRGRMVEL